jgi:hypothetical protein
VPTARWEVLLAFAATTALAAPVAFQRRDLAM